MGKAYWNYFVIPLLVYFLYIDNFPFWTLKNTSHNLHNPLDNGFFLAQSPSGNPTGFQLTLGLELSNDTFSEKEATIIVEDSLIHGQAHLHCSSYLAPTEILEWSNLCSSQCVIDLFNSFKWNFGIQYVVDFSRGQGINVESPVLPEDFSILIEEDFLFPEETVNEVPLAVLVLRALMYLKGVPALFILALYQSEINSTVEIKKNGSSWLKEASLLPNEVKASISSATLQGKKSIHLSSLLNNPLVVLNTLLTTRVSQFYPPLLIAGSENGFSSSNVVVFTSSLSIATNTRSKSYILERLKKLVCGLSLDWSVELISGQIRVFPPLRTYAMPPRTIPPAFWGEITSFGAVPVRYLYHNDALEPGGTPRIVHYSNGTISILLWKASRREEMYYGVTDTYLFNILDRNRNFIKDKRVAILGSLEPWYECVALTWGAREIFTIEYGGRTSDHPAFQFISPSLMEKSVAEGTFEPFDAAFSISSFEHDGLGRYGDPLFGDSDIKTMAFIRDNILLPGGHLFFTVPMGRDCILWNEERVYGKVRLPKLIEGWEVIDTEGVVQSMFEEGSEVCQADHWQPLYLLRVPIEKV